MKAKASVWVLIDGKIGNANQAIAVAKAIGLDFEIKNLKYNFLARLPNWLKFDSLIGVDLKASDKLDEAYPDLIISSGRRTAAVSNHIKKINPKTFTVHIMHPDLPFENFDLVALPFHDLSQKYADTPNITYTIGAPSYLDKSILENAKAELSARVSQLKGPYVSLIIGGKTKSGDYSNEEMRDLINKASAFTNEIKGSLLISTSRRTSLSAIKDIQKYITAPYFFYDWQLENAKNNPYLGFLALSDFFIVTGDSVSICSEALSTGKPVYVYRKDKLLYKKHRKFLDYLAQLGYTKQLEAAGLANKTWEYQSLHEAERLAKIINEKLINASSNIAI